MTTFYERAADLTDITNITVERVVVRPSIMDMVGKHHVVPGYYEVAAEKVREFSRAVQDRHPAHLDADASRELGHVTMIAPITFVSVVAVIALDQLFENLLIGYTLSDVLHTDQSVRFHRPIRVGDHLYSRLGLVSFRQMGGSDIMVSNNQITDRTGSPVVTTSTTFAARTGSHSNPELTFRLPSIMRQPDPN